MAEEKYGSFTLSLGEGGLKILASGSCALVLATGTAVGFIGIGIFCFTKAAAFVQLLLSPWRLGALVLSLALSVTLNTGIRIRIFHWIKALKNKIQKMC